MKIEERPTYFVQRPENTGEAYLVFRLVDEWYALDGEKLILPIDPIEKNGDDFSNLPPGLLSQYGGSELLLSMATTGEIEAGTKWYLSYDERVGFQIDSHKAANHDS